MSAGPAHLRRHLYRRRSWRLALALMADRIERRLGRALTEAEFDRLQLPSDSLFLRQTWLGFGGRLEVRNGRLWLSKDLPRRRAA